MLETIFYSLGIVTMTIFLLVLCGVIFAIYKAKQNVDTFKQSFMVKIVGLLKERNVEVASALGLAFAHFVIDRVRETVEGKRRRI